MYLACLFIGDCNIDCQRHVPSRIITEYVSIQGITT